jgi:hypothetical protein
MSILFLAKQIPNKVEYLTQALLRELGKLLIELGFEQTPHTHDAILPASLRLPWAKPFIATVCCTV